MKKGIIIVLISTITLYIWWQIFIPDTKSEKERIQAPIQYKEEKTTNQEDKFDKKYLALYGLDEDVSLREVTRYTRKISVNLGLSRKELEDNLIHAAWELQKEKNATSTRIIFGRQMYPCSFW